MATRMATVPTEHASRYLQQLCRHFAQKVPVDVTPDAGQITLPFGLCLLSAEQGVLRMTLKGPEASITRLERVIGDHFARFAFRENPTLTWTIRSNMEPTQ